jgi:hypothetical protein
MHINYRRIDHPTCMIDHGLDVDYNINCECGLKFDNVDQFEKHLTSCRIMAVESGTVASCDKKRRQILGLRKELDSTTKKHLNKLLKMLVSS